MRNLNGTAACNMLVYNNVNNALHFLRESWLCPARCFGASGQPESRQDRRSRLPVWLEAGDRDTRGMVPRKGERKQWIL